MSVPSESTIIEEIVEEDMLAVSDKGLLIMLENAKAAEMAMYDEFWKKRLTKRFPNTIKLKMAITSQNLSYYSFYRKISSTNIGSKIIYPIDLNRDVICLINTTLESDYILQFNPRKEKEDKFKRDQQPQQDDKGRYLIIPDLMLIKLDAGNYRMIMFDRKMNQDEYRRALTDSSSYTIYQEDITREINKFTENFFVQVNPEVTDIIREIRLNPNVKIFQ